MATTIWYNVFNVTDGFPANREYLESHQADQFIIDFPKRFASQGFYKNGSGERISPYDVILEKQAVETDCFCLSCGYPLPEDEDGECENCGEPFSIMDFSREAPDGRDKNGAPVETLDSLQDEKLDTSILPVQQANDILTLALEIKIALNALRHLLANDPTGKDGELTKLTRPYYPFGEDLDVVCSKASDWHDLIQEVVDDLNFQLD